MANIHDNQSTLTSYAEALLELADARGVTDTVAADVEGVAEVINNNAAFNQYLGDPTVGHTARQKMIDTVFGTRVSSLVVAFLQVLSSKNHLAHFPGIAAAFKRLLDHRKGTVDVEVTVAHKLDDNALADVGKQISGRLGKNAIVSQKVDESIIGGLILKFGDKLVDGSVKTQLETIKSRMIAAI